MHSHLVKQADKDFVIAVNPQKLGYTILLISSLVLALVAFDNYRLNRHRVHQLEYREFHDSNIYLEIPAWMKKP
ncbi:MAG: hypothetical protein KME59_18970 [Trichormus sp. ATA11-4-KO1]|nr:hypothetical protein [Trichormus sp. ATA11-4-KO1]